MRFIWSIVLAAAALFGAIAVTGEKTPDHSPYMYTIDLDLPAGQRFDHVVKDMCEDPVHIKAFLTLLTGLRQTLKEKLHITDALMLMIGNKFLGDENLKELGMELGGMADSFNEYCAAYNSVMGTMTLGELATLQLVYQIAMSDINNFMDTRDAEPRDPREAYNEIRDFFGMGCTSVVMEDESGHVFHGRNLDWAQPEFYSPLATELTYVKHDEDGRVRKVAVTMSFFPELTPTTAISKKLAFSYDARLSDKNDGANCLLSGQAKLDPFAILLRQMMLHEVDDYNTVYDMFSNQAKFCTAVYLVISGPQDHQGAILTYYPKDEEHPKPDVRTIGMPYNDEEDPRHGKDWYVIVSNEDIEYSAAKDWSARYNFTLQTMNSYSQNEIANFDAIEPKLLGVDGIYRSGRTCYAASMDVRNFQYSFVVRGQDIPEPQPEPQPKKDSVSSAASLKPWAYALVLVASVIAALL